MIGGLLKRKRMVICIAVVLVLAIGIGTIAFILNFNNAPKVKTVLEVEKIKKYEDSDSTEELDDSNMNIKYYITDSYAITKELLSE